MMANHDKTGSLFSAEEMTRIMGGFDFKDNSPVTCLGMEFENDEARRSYFREELRKKLPELRKIEGFPIGEDDDIINLSDPPYYTACPNPWLNMLINQWDEQKEQLVKEGKRKVDLEVKEPYANDVTEGKNNPVYTAHTYHTKVPHPAIMRYILHYTQPGDVVFDGFAGTGMTGVAAQACAHPTSEQRTKIEREWQDLFGVKPIWGERHAICGDLSPYASMISYNYNTPVNSALLEQEVKRIFEEVKEECKWMYTTMHDGKPALINYVVWSDVCTCSNCGQEFVYWDAAINYKDKCINESFECPHCKSIQNKKNLQKAFFTSYDKKLNESNTEVKQSPVIVVYTTKEGKRFERKPTDYDLEVVEKISNTECPYWYPTNKFMGIGEGWGDTWRAGVHAGITRVNHFYTKRNLIALSTFLAKLETSSINNKIKFLLTGMINRSCKMNRVHVSNYFNGGGGWNAGHLKGTLYIPSAPVETSILEQLEDKLNGYLRAIPLLPTHYGNALYVASANNTCIQDKSVDYIFVDPPFGANIMYSELNYLSEAWLKVVTNNQDEAIISTCQNKNDLYYLNMMGLCFSEFYRILKPGKWMTIEFSNTSASVWNNIQTAITKAGFIIANVSALNKGQGGMRSITTTTAVKQDLAISCYKPSDAVINKVEADSDNSLWNLVDEHLEHINRFSGKDSKSYYITERDPRIIYDRIISYYVQRGYPVPIDAKDFQEGLRDRYLEIDGMFFSAEQAAEYEKKKLVSTEFVPMGILVSDEANGIQWLKNFLKDAPKTYQEIQPEWMQALKAVKMENKKKKKKIFLEENFIEDAGGKWRIADPEKQADLDKLYIKNLMKEFNIYVEAVNKPKAKPIKQVRIEAVRAGFKDCYKKKDFVTIIKVGEKIPQTLLQEDEQLLRYYDVATRHI